MLISIDHGNKQIKTLNKVFTSAFTESDNKPAFGEDIIEYNGKFYTLSESRIPYMRNKALDDRYFILTLFGVATEIIETGNYSAGDVLDISLAVGLPPAHYGSQTETFENYFKNRDTIKFSYNSKPFEVNICETMCFPQAFAATIPIFNKLKDVSKAVVVDIGGFTADYILLRNGKAELSICDSLENGVILLYNSIRSKVNADFDVLLEECDIDIILKDGEHNYSSDVVNVVCKQAQKFINDLVGSLRERMVDLKTGKAVFIGGGSLLLRKQIEACDKIGEKLFVDDISANAKGYEILYRASKRK